VAQPPVERRDPASRWEAPRLTVQRLFGLDRSGPPPPQTLKGAPLNPWTVPNAIGYLRAALIPVFLAVAFSDGDGHDGVAALIFGIVTWGDYADGIAARVTRQYSRMGALMDPIIDRLIVVSGVVVAYHFQTLPRWALIVLAVREVVMLGLARYGLRRGLELKINWAGRLAVWPVMSALFGPLVGWDTAGEILLYIGLILAWIATAMYLRDGLARASLDPGPSS
jgi:phosphatidylglycerophosphate synthase